MGQEKLSENFGESDNSILVLTPMKIKPVEIVWANSRHSEVQKRLIKFNHLHAKNESYLLPTHPKAEPFLRNQGFIKSFFVLNHCT